MFHFYLSLTGLIVKLKTGVFKLIYGDIDTSIPALLPVVGLIQSSISKSYKKSNNIVSSGHLGDQ